MTATAAQLQALLAPPNPSDSQRHAQQLLSSALAAPIVPTKLGSLLSPLLTSESERAQALSSQLAESNSAVSTLVQNTKSRLADVLCRTTELRSAHEVLEDALIDHREALVSSFSQREQEGEGHVGGTLRERLQGLSEKRKELELARDWFSVLAKTEELGIRALRALEDTKLSLAFQEYVGLVEYTKTIHNQAPSLALASHLVAMALSVWNSLVKVLSTRLAERLTKLGWPTPFTQPLDWLDEAMDDFKTAFQDLLALEKLQSDHPLPAIASDGRKSTTEAKPLLAIVPLVHPLLLRFRWHFDGTRGTNRIDKPEYPLAHVLNLLTTHERFISEDIQDLLDSNGFSHIDAATEFTSLLLPTLASRLRSHVPQLLALPPVLAHTIYQTLSFDAVLRTRGYRPRGTKGEWGGLSEVVLGNKEWYERWLKGEREFFESRYYGAISATEAWQILSEGDYDATDARSAVRPTNSSLRVAELVEQLADRYRPLPTPYTLPFLLSLHLPLLSSYSDRITSSLDAFENLSFGLGLPGALGVADGRTATAGTGGVVRLVRAGVSARWMGEKCAEWGEDAFFLALWEYLKNPSTSIPVELRPEAEKLLAASGGSLFDGVRVEFEGLAERADELVVRHVVREVLGELKSYLGRRWDYPPPAEEEDPSLTPDLIAPLSLLSSLLSSLTSSFPPTLATTLYRRISTALSHALYERLLVNRSWSESGAKQLGWDLEYGFLQAGREAGIRRGVARGWELMLGGAKIMALPTGGSEQWTFAKVMQMAWDDSIKDGEGSRFRDAMEELGVGEVVGKKEVQAVMRRRPECWR